MLGLAISQPQGVNQSLRSRAHDRDRLHRVKIGPVKLPSVSCQERASGALAERRRYTWEVESPSAKVAESDKFRCSGVPFRQAMSLRLEPNFKFIIGAEDSEDLRLRLGVCVGNRRGSIHILR